MTEQQVSLAFTGEEIELIINALSYAAASVQFDHSMGGREEEKQCDLTYQAFHRAMHKVNAEERFNGLQHRLAQTVLDHFRANSRVQVVDHPVHGTGVILDDSKRPVS